MKENDQRLIEDYLPIEAISAEASREKSVRKGHISTLHLWWARRPLVACRAAVYGALLPSSQFVPNGASDEKKKSLGRANAAKFVKALCQYPGSPQVIKEAQQHILAAHAERLTQEIADWQGGNTDKPAWVDEFKFTGNKVTQNDIAHDRAPRPRVLDMFAGGGAIPLEALRLGCEAYAMDLNPVAYIIELCTLVYPQKYGKPDPNVRGMTGPKNPKGETTWGGLANEVRYWGEWVLKKVKGEIGDLYPLIPDPEYKGKHRPIQTDWLKEHEPNEILPGYLMPVAYLWTRTVICKNPNCKAIVPLVRQTWLCKKRERYVALKMIVPRGQKQVRFEVVEARSEKALGFDPTGFSKGGNATCPFCGTVAGSDYVKAEGIRKTGASGFPVGDPNILWLAILMEMMPPTEGTAPDLAGEPVLAIGRCSESSFPRGGCWVRVIHRGEESGEILARTLFLRAARREKSRSDRTTLWITQGGATPPRTFCLRRHDPLYPSHNINHYILGVPTPKPEGPENYRRTVHGSGLQKKRGSWENLSD
jgi:putative DNA methylase